MAEANREGITMRWKNGQSREADDRKRVNERKSLKLLLRERVRGGGRQGLRKREHEKARKRREVRKSSEEEFIVSSVTLCAVSVKHGEEEEGKERRRSGAIYIYDGSKRSF